MVFGKNKNKISDKEIEELKKTVKEQTKEITKMREKEEQEEKEEEEVEETETKEEVNPKKIPERKIHVVEELPTTAMREGFVGEEEVTIETMPEALTKIRNDLREMKVLLG